MKQFPRVLLTTYHHAYLKKAGGEFEVFSISEKLKRHGLIADIYGPHSRELEHYDAVLHFSVHGGGLDMLQHVHQQGKPIVLWPNVWLENADSTLINLVNQHVNLSQSVIFKSQAELDIFKRWFDLPPSKVRRTLAVADSAYSKPAPSRLFPQLYDLGDYAIWLGIIEPNKNQLAAIRVLAEAGIHLVLVGGHRDVDYYKACRSAAGNKVLFIDALPAKSEILRSALRDALFYIETSFEPPGLSAIEAGIAGCKLVLSDSVWSREHFSDLAFYCQPDDPSSIDAAVKRALSCDNYTADLTQHLMKHCADDAIDSLVQVFQEAV